MPAIATPSRSSRPSLQLSALILFFAVTLGLGVQACAARTTLANHDQPPAVQTPAGTGLALPLPSQLRATTAIAGQVKLGREYEALLPHNLVAAEGDYARFSPDWVAGGGITGAAYAIYEFGLTDYTGEQSLSLTWVETGSFANAWLGLANFAHDRWDWLPMPAASGNVSRLDIAFAEYIQPSGGRMLVVPLFIDPAPVTWLLGEVRVGAPLPPAWLHTWGGAQSDMSFASAVDSSGSIYLCGCANASGEPGSELLALLKYSTSGELTWLKGWSGGSNCYGKTIAVTGAGEIYLAGTMSSLSTYEALVIMRLNSNGEPVWQKKYAYETHPVWCNDLALAPNGDVFVLGTMRVDNLDGISTFQMNSVLLKIAPDGTLIWCSIWGGNNISYPSAVVPDDTGGCIVGGLIDDISQQKKKVMALKFNSSGSVDWANSWASSGSSGIMCMERGANGKVWCGGYVTLAEVQYSQGLLLELDQESGYVESSAMLSTPEGCDLCGIAVAEDQTIYIGGRDYSYTPDHSDALYAVLKNNQLGKIAAWGGESDYLFFSSCVIDNNGAVLLSGCGISPSECEWRNVTASYQTGITGTVASENTTLVDLPGTLTEIAGTWSDLSGIQDAPTGDVINSVVCKL
jgi:hypothetical protein